MTRSADIPLDTDFEAHYRAWVEEHPDALPYEDFSQHVDQSDRLKLKVSISRLARACMTTNNTMRRWLPAYRAQRDRLEAQAVV